MARQIAAYKAALWVRINWRRIAAVAAVPVIAFIGYQAYDRYWSWSSAVDAGLRVAAANETWREGFSQPAVRVIAGKPIWVVFHGDTDTTAHANAQGVPVEMRCVHLYAQPAEPDFGQYVKPEPFALFGWWLKWPERAVQCKFYALQQEAQK